MSCGTRKPTCYRLLAFFSHTVYRYAHGSLILHIQNSVLSIACMGCVVETVKMLLPIEILVECYIIQH